MVRFCIAECEITEAVHYDSTNHRVQIDVFLYCSVHFSIAFKEYVDS